MINLLTLKIYFRCCSDTLKSSIASALRHSVKQGWYCLCQCVTVHFVRWYIDKLSHQFVELFKLKMVYFYFEYSVFGTQRLDQSNFYWSIFLFIYWLIYLFQGIALHEAFSYLPLFFIDITMEISRLVITCLRFRTTWSVFFVPCDHYQPIISLKTDHVVQKYIPPKAEIWTSI